MTEVASVEDALGYPCSSDAVVNCSDCGARLCDLHAANCGLCHGVFCATCLGFHARASHQKKDALWAEIAEKMKKKTA